MTDGSYLTQKGRNLIGKIIGTEMPLTFTRVTVGSGIPATSDAIDADGTLHYTALRGYVMDAQALRRRYVGNGTATISATVINATSDDGFDITEAALWAMDPQEGEILYCYMALGEHPQHVSGASAPVAAVPTLEFIALIGGVHAVTIQIGPDSLVTWDELREYAATVEHTHEIPDVRGLQDALDSKADKSELEDVLAQIISSGAKLPRKIYYEVLRTYVAIPVAEWQTNALLGLQEAVIEFDLKISVAVDAVVIIGFKAVSQTVLLTARCNGNKLYLYAQSLPNMEVGVTVLLQGLTE